MRMELLRKLAADLKAAYAEQDDADAIMRMAADYARQAQIRQCEYRGKIIEELGHEEGSEFLNMLREQAEHPKSSSGKILSFEKATVIEREVRHAKI